ncbi:histidine kinase [Thiocystis violacea]|nr:histidine kinase [Thiocystis violacea]
MPCIAIEKKPPLSRNHVQAVKPRPLRRAPSSAARVRRLRWSGLCSLFLVLIAPVTAGEHPHVLVLYGYDRLLPAIVRMNAGLRETISPEVQISTEFLDYPRFSGESYARTVTRFLVAKYAAQPPDLIIAGGENALTFLLAKRAELFPRAGVVHMATRKYSLDLLPALPADVVGIPVEYDFSRTIELALRLHPRADRLVLVTGATPYDRSWETRLREEAPRFAGRVKVEFLAGLPTATVLKRLGELGTDAIIFSPGYFQDGTGKTFIPLKAAIGMVEAATAPFYAPSDTAIGIGIVGGYTPSFVAMGREAGLEANALLAGVAPQDLKLPKVMPTTLKLDWRQILRWGIAQHAIPDDAEIYFRAPTFLDAHRKEAISAAVVFLLQSGLIGWLLIERRRRQQAEQAEQQQRFELVHASRLAVAGELTASIAHEINQPLGAILNNADAAELILDSGPASDHTRREALRAILADIRHDDLRASEVIRRLRGLLAKHQVERQVFDLREATTDAVHLLRIEARRRRIEFILRVTPTPATMVGDRIQIQQVVIILLINAMDAIGDLPDDRRQVVISIEERLKRFLLSVRDRGCGIASEHPRQMFDSFFSTKHAGMGLGLSIAQTLVNAHKGRIWAEPTPDEGALFHVELPAIGAPGK